MPDVFTESKRSQIMGSVRSVDTSAERRVEVILQSLKIKFSRNLATLPGKPDFVLNRFRVALFVHGCFWHSHTNCKNATPPTSNADYWSRKFIRNRKRDKRVRQELRTLGWRTAVIWECKLRNSDSITRRLLKLTWANGKKLT